MSKKLLIAAVMAVLVVGVSIAQATPSRIETLGQGSGLQYIQDDTSIFINPATAASYSKSVLLHMGGLADTAADDDMHAYGGVILGMGDTLSIGLVAGRNPDFETGDAIDYVLGGLPGGLFANNWALGAYGDPAAIVPAGIGNQAIEWMNPIDVMVAAGLGNLNVGISYYTASGKYLETREFEDAAGVETANNETERKTRLSSLKIGIAGDMGNMSPELWFHYNPYKLTSSFTDDLALAPIEEWTRELKGRRINLGARAFLKWATT